MSCLDYSTVWEVMNDLDEIVQKTKQIETMSRDLLDELSEATENPTILDAADLLRLYSHHILGELENAQIRAWNETVVKLRSSVTKTTKHGKDLDMLDASL
tara:strand:- start:2558 stop:2860 length:303 start_codon:yes stop_codon:yes gene_type:complete